MFLLIAALALPAFAQEERDADDPIGRMRAARSLDDGIRTPEVQSQILDAAQSEALKARARRSAAAVAGSAWVNIGPTTADFENNGGQYFKVDSGRARRILVDPNDANVVYFATSGGGVWKTHDALTAVSSTTGPHWTPITEGVFALSVGSLAMNPGNSLSLLLGLGDPFDVQTPGHSIVTSDDGGISWSDPVALAGSYDSGASFYTATSVREFAFDPGGANVFAATDAGLFFSSQGGVGASWSLKNIDAATHHPQDCWSVVYAAPHVFVAACIDFTSSAGRVFRTPDDGASWAEVTSQMCCVSSDFGRITLAASSGGGTSRVYALSANKAMTDQQSIFRSDDAGNTWSPALGSLTNPTDHQTNLDLLHNQAAYNQMLVVDPANSNTVFFGGNYSMARSTDGGSAWTIMTDWLPFDLNIQTGGLDNNINTMAQYAHADWHAATIAHVGGTAYFYGGNDGGLIRASSNVLTAAPGSVTWEDRLNRGIVSHLVYSVASGKERPATGCTGGGTDIVYGGFQDNGTRLRALTGTNKYVGYNQIVGGDGFGVALGCSSAGAAMGTQLLRTYVDQIWTSSNGGSSFTERVSRDSGTGNSVGLTPTIAMDHDLNFKMKVVADLSTDSTYLTPVCDSSGGGHVYLSTDNGVTWNGINGTIHTEAGGTMTSWPKPMRNVAAHPKTHNMYAAVDGGRVYVTSDAGVNWTESKRAVSTTTTDYLSLATVAFDPGDLTGNTAWAGAVATTLSTGAKIPAGKGHLFKCTGLISGAPATCTPMSSGIPEVVPVNVVKVDPGSSSTIYVGTEIGMYRSTDGGATFSRYGTNLPFVSVTDIAVNADGSAIRVSTFGRGFWEIYPSTSAPSVAGNGDLDYSGVIDGFDLVREAAIEFSDRTQPDFNAAADLVPAAAPDNVILDADLTALLAKLGGTP